MKISIECNHITNPLFLSKDISFDLALNFKKQNKNGNIVILIDDFHSDFNEETKTKLKNKFGKDATLFWESDFKSLAEQILSTLPTTYKNNKIYLKNSSIILKKERVTCPILTAAWYLYRLNFNNEKFKTIKLLNFLPEKYRKNEENVLKILTTLNIPEYLVETIYYKEESPCEFKIKK